MTNEQILKKAIEKAVKNGYKPVDYEFKIKKASSFLLYERQEPGISSDSVVILEYQTIFSHDFAKAFWGEEEIETDIVDFCEGENDACFKDMPKWQYHLPIMVLEKDPIKYLKINIKK